MSTKKRESWKHFPSVSTLAYYSPMGNYIKLNKVTESILRKIRNEPESYLEQRAVLVHEYQHWIDHVSTFWGQENISKIFLAFESCFSGNEKDFHRMRTLYNSLKGDRLLDFYTESYEEIQGAKENRWKYGFSAGIRYDSNGDLDLSKPIIFVRFRSSDDIPIIRVPLSVTSLLETTAVAREIVIKIDAISRMEEQKGERELEILQTRLEKQLYNPELTLYSVAVHTVSNLLKISDPIIGYQISSQIASLALNLPNSVFENIIIPENTKEYWGDHCPEFLKSRNRGFAFFCLTMNYSNRNQEYDQGSFIDDVLECSGLPNKGKLDELIEEELLELQINTSVELRFLINLYLDKNRAGKKFRDIFGTAGESDEPFRLVDDSYPYIMCSNTYFNTSNIELSDVLEKLSLAQEITREEWWVIFEFCEDKIDEFNEICGI